MNRLRTRFIAALSLAAAGVAATASAAFAAPSVSVSPTVNLTPGGKSVNVTGAEIPLDTGTPPDTGLYAAQIAVVDGTTYHANHASSMLVRTNPDPTSAKQAKLEDDGSFATSVTVVRSWAAGATTVDCMAANTECFVASWPAHGNPSAGNVIDSVAIEFADVQATPVSDLDPAGASVSVTGTNLALDTGATFPGAGLYAAQIAIVDGTTIHAYNANAKFVRRTPDVASPNQAKLEDDGSFATSVTVVRSWTAGATTVDCMAANTECFVASWPAHGNPTADSLIDSVPIAFAADPGPGPGPGPGPSPGAPSISVSPSAGLTGPTGVSVTGSGFSTTPPGIYVVYGPMAGNTNPAAYYGPSSQFLAPGGGISASGTFATTMQVVPSYTDGNGNHVDCTVVQCYVRTMRAHGMTDVDQDTAVPITFAATVKTAAPDAAPPAPAPAGGPVGPASGPAAGAPSGSSPATVPALGRPTVRRNGRVAVRVSEPSTVTFVLRRKVGRKGDRRWKVVKVVRVRVGEAGVVRARLPLRRAGRYKISTKAVSSVTGKASEKSVKRFTVKRGGKKASRKRARARR